MWWEFQTRGRLLSLRRHYIVYDSGRVWDYHQSGWHWFSSNGAFAHVTRLKTSTMLSNSSRTLFKGCTTNLVVLQNSTRKIRVTCLCMEVLQWHHIMHRSCTSGQKRSWTLFFLRNLLQCWLLSWEGNKYENLIVLVLSSRVGHFHYL